MTGVRTLPFFPFAQTDALAHKYALARKYDGDFHVEPTSDPAFFLSDGGLPASRWRPLLRRDKLSAPVYGPALLLVLAACGGGSGGTQPAPVTVDLTGSMATGVYGVRGNDGVHVIEVTGDMDSAAIDRALTNAGIRTQGPDGGDGVTIFDEDIVFYQADGILNPDATADLDGKDIAIFTGAGQRTGRDGITNLFLAHRDANEYDGGNGENILSYAYAPTAIDINLGLQGIDQDQNSPDSWAHGDNIHNDINHIIGSDHAEGDTITGDGEDNIIEGRGGPDTLDGRTGMDTLSFESSPAGVSVSLTTNTGSGGHAEGDTYRSFEHITGSVHNDRLTGSPDTANHFTGGRGADRIDGGDETGDSVSDDNDRVIYAGSEAGVR